MRSFFASIVFVILANHQVLFAQCNIPIPGNANAQNPVNVNYSTTACGMTPAGIRIGGTGNNNGMGDNESVTFDTLITNGGALTTNCGGGTLIVSNSVTISSALLACDLTVLVRNGGTLNVTNDMQGDLNNNSNSNITIRVETGGRLNVGRDLNLGNNIDITVQNGGIFTVGRNLTALNDLNLNLQQGAISNIGGSISSGNNLTVSVGTNADLNISGGFSSGNNIDFAVSSGADVAISGNMTVGNGAQFNIAQGGDVTVNSITGGQNASLIINGVLEVTTSLTLQENAVVSGNGILIAQSVTVTGPPNGNAQTNSQGLCGQVNAGNEDFCNLLFDVDNCTDPKSDLCIDIGNNLLPVTLTYFNTAKKGDWVEAKWGTASELNNDFFTVEESVDGHNFVEVASVKGSGTHEGAKAYQAAFQPYHKQASVLYYRLKQTDFDGTFAYSKILKVAGFQIKSGVTLYPNPAKGGAFSVSALGQPVREVRVIDLQGREAFREVYPEAKTNEEIHLQLSVPAGIYQVLIQTDQQMIPLRVVISE